ncbi:MAG: ATP-binding cassette domain-containing protein [Ruminiclostridium sp.]
MIKIENLCKKYGELSVLENVSAEIHKGDVVSIIGPSGCGKSTFMRCLNLMEQPTSGRILIDGQDILDKKADVCKLLSMSILRNSAKSIACTKGLIKIVI